MKVLRVELAWATWLEKTPCCPCAGTGMLDDGDHEHGIRPSVVESRLRRLRTARQSKYRSCRVDRMAANRACRGWERCCKIRQMVEWRAGVALRERKGRRGASKPAQGARLELSNKYASVLGLAQGRREKAKSRVEGVGQEVG